MNAIPRARRMISPGENSVALSQGNRYRGKFTYGSTLRRESKGHCYLPSPYPPPTWLRGKIFFHRYFPASLLPFPQDDPRYLPGSFSTAILSVFAQLKLTNIDYDDWRIVRHRSKLYIRPNNVRSRMLEHVLHRYPPKMELRPCHVELMRDTRRKTWSLCHVRVHFAGETCAINV